MSKRRKKKEKKKNKELKKWTKYIKVTKQEECLFLQKKKQSNLNERVCLIEGFSLVTGLQELLELIVEQSNLYAHENGRNCTVTKEEWKPFVGINFVVAINKLPMIAEYW